MHQIWSMGTEIWSRTDNLTIPKLYSSTVKPVLNIKNRQNKYLNDKGYLNEGRKYCRMLPWSILQYFCPALSNNWSRKPVFGLLLSGRLRQVFTVPSKGDNNHTCRSIAIIPSWTGVTGTLPHRALMFSCRAEFWSHWSIHTKVAFPAFKTSGSAWTLTSRAVKAFWTLGSWLEVPITWK